MSEVIFDGLCKFLAEYIHKLVFNKNISYCICVHNTQNVRLIQELHVLNKSFSINNLCSI